MQHDKIKTFLPWDEIEPQAQQQILNTASLDIIKDHIAIMPDCHYGKGATVGSVIPTYKAIIPATVGVDIGCGMEAVKLNRKGRDIDEKMLRRWYAAMSNAIPLGAGGRNEEIDGYAEYLLDRNYFESKLINIDSFSKNWRHQLGTLGSGNHFIELCLDQNDDLWLMLHSGSRGVGNRIGTYYIEKAKESCIKIGLPDSDLSFLDFGSPEFGEYCEALQWAQLYASFNRKIMLDRCEEILRWDHILGYGTGDKETAISCHHNYVEFLSEDLFLTRKGAISAQQGEMGIIPGSMGTKSYIVRGKGNPDSHCSASHGAGRTMSRGEAKRRFTLDDLIAQTEGVVCPKNESVIDEIPAAYKDIDTVIARQSELIEVVYTLKQIMNIKG